MEEYKLYLTNERCPMCRFTLLKLEPKCGSWSYWCPKCNVLTASENELKVIREVYAKAELPKSCVGFIYAVAAPFSKEDAEFYRKRVEEIIRSEGE